MRIVKTVVDDLSTGRLERSVIRRVPNLSDLKERLKNGYFDFNWQTELVFEVYALTLESTDRTLGLMSFEAIPDELRIEIKLLESSKENIGKRKNYSGIAGNLIAFACREAFSRGYYGFVSLVPKTELIGRYIREYGFVQAGRHLATDLDNSKKLIDKYLTIAS